MKLHMILIEHNKKLKKRFFSKPHFKFLESVTVQTIDVCNSQDHSLSASVRMHSNVKCIIFIDDLGINFFIEPSSHQLEGHWPLQPLHRW